MIKQKWRYLTINEFESDYYPIAHHPRYNDRDYWVDKIRATDSRIEIIFDDGYTEAWELFGHDWKLMEWSTFRPGDKVLCDGAAIDVTKDNFRSINLYPQLYERV